jgi:hypothetical protein
VGSVVELADRTAVQAANRAEGTLNKITEKTWFFDLCFHTTSQFLHTLVGFHLVGNTFGVETKNCKYKAAKLLMMTVCFSLYFRQGITGMVLYLENEIHQLLSISCSNSISLP